ncbi:glycosyltransferase, partial [Actinocorallia longicatena]|uniref:glycosyltransferase n=1 Tax=Actinocorallia longicatena TaxID=111803 RepID=UPI0031DE3802
RGPPPGRGGLRFAAAGPPVVVTLHNALITGGAVGAVYGALERVVARGATAVLGVSPDLEERMRELGADDVGRALVPAPPHRGAPAARDGVREELAAGDRMVVLTVARLAEQKGLPDLLKAAALLRERPMLFVVAGDGPLDGLLRETISSDDLPVRLLGRRSDVPELLAAADIVAVPSVWEGQPLFVQEALEAGRPIVATAVGGIPEMVGDAALLVPAGDGAALAGALGRFVDEPGLTVRMGAAAAQRALSLPDEDAATDQLSELYARIRPGK